MDQSIQFPGTFVKLRFTVVQYIIANNLHQKPNFLNNYYITIWKLFKYQIPFLNFWIPMFSLLFWSVWLQYWQQKLLVASLTWLGQNESTTLD